MSIMQIGTHHFAWFGEETILQIHGIGPWTVTYVDPTDDPKNQAAATTKSISSRHAAHRFTLRCARDESPLG